MAKEDIRIGGIFCKPGLLPVVSWPSVLNSGLCSHAHDVGNLPEATFYSVTLPGCYWCKVTWARLPHQNGAKCQVESRCKLKSRESGTEKSVQETKKGGSGGIFEYYLGNLIMIPCF